MDETLEALSKRVLEEWEDDERHAKFLVYAQETQQLPAAAAFYKKVVDSEASEEIPTERLEDAKKRLGGVAMLAMLDIERHKSDPLVIPGQKLVRAIAIIVAVALFAAAGWMLLHR